MIAAPSPYLLAIVLVILSGLDLYSTVRGLAAGGKEINPIGRAFFSLFGVVAGGALLKILGLSVVLFVTFRYPALWYVAAVYAFLLLGIVVRNLAQAAD